jgi:ParB-like chromosome segregation protein Spo0J
MKTEKVKIEKIKINKQNPRRIDKTQLDRLKKSIQDFPKMLELRPIVVNNNYEVLGGNMRLKALKELGYKDVIIVFADELTESEQKEFIIKDNVSFGDWDFEMLENEWDSDLLKDWGLDLPEFQNNYSEKNKEIDVDDFDTQMTIKLSYTESDYWKVKKALNEIASTPEEAIFKLLNLDTK